MGLISKVFGTYSDRQIKKLKPIADKIESLSDKYMAMSDEQQMSSRADLRRERRLTIFCRMHLRLYERRLTESSASVPFMFSCSEVSFFTKAELPR